MGEATWVTKSDMCICYPHLFETPGMSFTLCLWTNMTFMVEYAMTLRVIFDILIKTTIMPFLINAWSHV